MKKCTRCKETKELSEFYKKGKNYRSFCKKCCNKYNRDYYKKNSIRAKELNKKYRKENPKKVIEYREKNYKSINKCKKEYKKNNPEKVKVIYLINGMRKRSKKKGFAPPEWTRKEIEEIIINGKCYKTNIPFDFTQSEKYLKNPWAPSPDRINPKLGYIKENTQWVCYMYNAMKNEFDEKDVLYFIKQAFKNINS